MYARSRGARSDRGTKAMSQSFERTETALQLSRSEGKAPQATKVRWEHLLLAVPDVLGFAHSLLKSMMSCRHCKLVTKRAFHGTEGSPPEKVHAVAG